MKLAVGCRESLRSGDDDFGVNHLLLKDTVLTLLIGGGDEGVSLVLEPLAYTELVLCGTEETRLLLRGLTTFVENSEDLTVACTRH